MTEPTPRPFRSFGAVAAGLMIVIIFSTATDAAMHASRIFPPPGEAMSDSLWLLASAYRFLYNMMGGYAAAALAPHRPMRHAWVLAGIGTVLGLLGVVVFFKMGENAGPLWYPVGLAVAAIPGVMLGAKLRRKRGALG